MRIMYEETTNVQNLAFTKTLGGMPDKESLYYIGAYQIGFKLGYEHFLIQIQKGQDKRNLSDWTLSQLGALGEISFLQSYFDSTNPSETLFNVFKQALEILSDDPSRIVSESLLAEDKKLLDECDAMIGRCINREKIRH